MRTCEVLVLNFTQSYLARKLQEFLFWVRLPACDSCFRTRGGLAQMAERSLRMRQARGSMPLSSTRATFVAHEHEPPFPGLVSSVGRAHDSYDLRRSHERRRLLRSCGRGFNPRIGCKEFSSSLFVGPLSMRSRVPRKNARQTRVRVPARETTSKQAHCATAYAVPRSLGGQDSRFSLSPLCVAPTP